MSEGRNSGPLPEEDYEAIESAVMETARGRWFLAEYARRNRSADTTMLLDAIKRLENALDTKPRETSEDELRFDLMEMAATIAQTRLDIAAIATSSGDQSQLNTVAGELDLVVGATEQATYKILAAAESIQEVAWDMRACGLDGENSDLLERYATDIFSACEFQDITGQRITKVVDVLNYIEERLNSMIDIWGDKKLIEQSHTPDDLDLTQCYLRPEIAISQDDVDSLMFVDHKTDTCVVEESEVCLEPVEQEIEPNELLALDQTHEHDEDEETETGRTETTVREPLLQSAAAAIETHVVDIEDEDEPACGVRALGQDEKTVLFC